MPDFLAGVELLELLDEDESDDVVLEDLSVDVDAGLALSVEDDVERLSLR